MTFVIAWGILGLYIFASETMVGWFGNLTGRQPLFYVAVYAPAITALAVIFYRKGFGGIGRFLSRLLLWRTSIYWYVMLILIVPLVFYVGALFQTRRPGHAVSVCIGHRLSVGTVFDGHQRTHRGNRLAWTGPAFASASNDAHIGFACARSCLGGLAPACVYAQRHTAKCLGIDTVPFGHPGPNRNGIRSNTDKKK